VKAVITWVSYTYNQITLYGRAEDGSRVIKKFTPNKPYFYVRGNGEYKSFVRDKNTNEEIPLVKIEVDNPLQIRSERMKYSQTWEADIPFIDRVLHDKGIKKAIDLDTLEPVNNFYTEPRKAYIDIENDDSEGFPDPDKAEKEVYCFTIIDSFTKIAMVNTTKPFLTKEFLEKLGHIKFRLIFHPNEKAMLSALNRYLATPEYQPDVILGWNVDDFDVKYLYNRMKNLGIGVDGWEGILVFDLLKAYRRWKENKQKSYKLDYIANLELGYGKVERKEKVSKMTGLDMAYYNYMDSYICYDLDEKLGLFKYYYDLSEFTGTTNISRWNASYIWDSVLLGRLKGTNLVLPTAEKDEKVGVEGGYVLKAIMGFFRHVKVLDFKSEYPNMIYTFNMSPDSIDPNGEIIFPMVRFRKEPLGLIPELIKEFIQKRDDIKKSMKSLSIDSMVYKVLNNAQRVLKEVTNAIYGLLGNEHFRLYDERIQAAITYGAREHIKYVVEWLENKNTGEAMIIDSS
jgi:DNA polymerase elongation subunit (family B)